ncbi:hypothetical protein KKG82_03685 [Patescibacteria group bacterium]|nr:hypothetical protein [Patescibacteria group bacterium]
MDDFVRDLKRLKRKFPSLEGDIGNFEKFIPAVDFDNNKRFVTLSRDLQKGVRVLKTRLMVRSLKGSSMTRLIFSFCMRENAIDFIEIYLKSQKSREDSARIDAYLNSL